MQILINHVTRMSAGYVCVAGIDVLTDEHIRPLLPPPASRLPVSVLAKHGGVFGLKRVVELGCVRRVGCPPQIEDVLIDLKAVQLVGVSVDRLFWDRISGIARPRFRDIFGPDLEPIGRTAAVPEGRGTQSLGCLRPVQRPGLVVDWDAEDVRLHVQGADLCLRLPVTDASLYLHDHKTLDRDAVRALARRLAAARDVLLSVGLGPPWQRPGDRCRRHWLQVNNIFTR